MDIGEFRGWIDRVDPQMVPWSEVMEEIETLLGELEQRDARIRELEAQVRELEGRRPIAEIRRQQNAPDSTSGLQTNGPPPHWVRFGAGPWRRVRARWMSTHKLLRALEELFELEEAG